MKETYSEQATVQYGIDDGTFTISISYNIGKPQRILFEK